MFAIMPMETEGHGREFGRRQKMRAKCTVEFVCKYCQRRFTKPYNLMIHERSHKDDVTFTCEVCGKSFKRQDNLKQHRVCCPSVRPFTSVTSSKEAFDATNKPDDELDFPPTLDDTQPGEKSRRSSTAFLICPSTVSSLRKRRNRYRT
ncbi:protein drumstick isoform X1 [Vespula squamosa]|uniref:Protein drumstick n=1 Tax=Vespula squamosa TaxID=30214 RepID=A0ABD2B1I8_VESSQ